ncbi:hypothetical protein [Haloterrigena alkaliphila]|uniref:Uncharacterized protein n=1 Tax=Haloterrigena alkaliphila TaxID=2816475 RepID=A0A8A2VK49_9EURY|nr:hypothetical protein [Haloterrigena alkaliphila]QSX01091.1 hypothetical protein J0X25_09105 [Haloterrigena alkaliphila]
MALPVSVDDWPETDRWWDAFTGERQMILAADQVRRVDEAWKQRHWESVDQFWDGFKADHELHSTDQFTQRLDQGSKSTAWEEIDSFWASYVEDHQSELAELQRLLGTVSDMWEDGASPFDDDPLTADWRSQSSFEGPLRRTVDEEDWSHWLAHLLWQSAGAFPAALLGTPDQAPERVRREVVFHGERSNRRVDILVEYAGTAVSIEVKTGDEQYGKTPHTAELVERHDDRDWSHELLIQRSKHSQLQYTFGDELVQPIDERSVIQAGDSPEVTVRFWQDVSRVLRRLLSEGQESDSHWQASAYLFVTLIEQRLLGFHPVSDLCTAEAGDRIAGMDLHQLTAVDPTAQIKYLRRVLTEEDTHE